jgi:hypothetical protein
MGLRPVYLSPSSTAFNHRDQDFSGTALSEARTGSTKVLE